MKWPNRFTIVRHGQSEYNALRDKKIKSPIYQAFLAEFEKNHQSEEARKLARQVKEAMSLGVSDYDTALTDAGVRQARETGEGLSVQMGLPDIIFFSPYLRTRKTLDHMIEGWPELAKVRKFEDDRLREQEHGLSLLYNDGRVFQTFHPEQKEFHALMGRYWYQYPQGESVSQVRDRVRLFLDMLIRECATKHVLIVSHHLTKLSVRANLERLTDKEFIRLDEHEKPVNCGVTSYKGNPHAGTNGKLELEFYNKKLWT